MATSASSDSQFRGREPAIRGTTLHAPRPVDWTLGRKRGKWLNSGSRLRQRPLSGAGVRGIIGGSIGSCGQSCNDGPLGVLTGTKPFPKDFPKVRSRFGEFVLDLPQRQLLREGRAVHLTPKSFELLSLLLDRAPAAISKDEIVRVVWGASEVTDASLTNVVAEIRAALDDDARQPRFVRTVHGFGYAFCGDLTRETPVAAGGAWHLVVAGRRIVLSAGTSLIGRDQAADIFLDHTSVSRRHAQLLLSADRLTIE